MNFFKSYKVDFTHVNIVYKFDDSLNNWISIIDRVLFKRILNKKDHLQIDDDLSSIIIHTNPKDVINILEMITLNITKWRHSRFIDEVELRDRISSLLFILYKKDYGSPYKEQIQKLIYVLHKKDVIKLSLASFRISQSGI